MGMRGCHRVDMSVNKKSKLSLVTDMYCNSAKAKECFWKECAEET